MQDYTVFCCTGFCFVLKCTVWALTTTLAQGPGMVFLCHIQFANPNADQTFLWTNGLSVTSAGWLHVSWLGSSLSLWAAGSYPPVTRPSVRGTWLSAACVWSYLWVRCCACKSSSGNLICGVKSWKHKFAVPIHRHFLHVQRTKGERHKAWEKNGSPRSHAFPPASRAWHQVSEVCTEMRTHLLFPNYRFNLRYSPSFTAIYCLWLNGLILGPSINISGLLLFI